MSTSFVKKINTAPQLYKTTKGVKPFPNGQYGTSTGTPSLDAFIPGHSLPIGSVNVLFEDTFSRYYVHLLKSYMAEGIVNEHKVLVVDADGEFREKDYWQKFLPAVYKVKDGESKEAASTSSSDGLKVAWRYNNLLEESKGAGGGQ
jgi:hypothetical protein